MHIFDIIIIPVCVRRCMYVRAVHPALYRNFRYNGRSGVWGRGVGGIGVVLANGGALLPSNIRLLISLILTHVKQQKKRTQKRAHNVR